MELGNIFPETPDFITSLKQLNGEEEKVCVELFYSLAEKMLVSKSGKESAELSSMNFKKHEDILNSILERVAFFPLKPNVMQAELTRLGLSASHSSALASAWASIAKTLVLGRRRVDTNVEGIHYQVLRRLPQDQESVLFHIQLEGAPSNVKLRFEPDELFQFYEQLQQIQDGIDRICQ